MSSEEVEDLGDQGGVRGALPGLALEQARRGVQQEPQERAIGFGQVQRPLHGAPGGGRVAQCVPGDQLARLSAGARDALQMASVLGRRFSADELAGLTGTTPAAILGALREALAAGLVIEDGDRVAFRHDLVREAVDATLPRTVRQSLRRRAIDVMLRHGAPASDVAELVMDVAQPGDAEEIAILRRAAAETGRVSPTVASLLSRRALDLTSPGDPARGPLTAETLAYLMYLSMQYASADMVDQCQRALELPDVPAALRVQLLSFLSLGLDLLGDASAAERAAADAVETAQASGDPAD